MEDNILLSDFIKKVKGELKNSQSKSEDAFFELTDVELEVSFAVATKGKAKGKLVVLEIGGETAALHTHLARLKFKPLGIKDADLAMLGVVPPNDSPHLQERVAVTGRGPIYHGDFPGYMLVPIASQKDTGNE